jgi:hypothetical protein
VKFKPLFVFLIIHSSICYGQRLNNDSLARQNAIQVAKMHHQKTIAGNSQVFNGVEYIDPLNDKKQIGHPYYFNDDWEEGFVHYDGQLYEHVLLRYNLLEDNVLIDHSQTHATIKLFVEKIKYFGINNHTFVWVERDPENIIHEGFYELLYANKSKVIARRYKTTIDIAEEKVMEVKFVDKTKLILFKEEKYYAITNKSSVLNAFGESRSQIKRFLSQNKINFRADSEAALIAIANYYDELKK